MRPESFTHGTTFTGSFTGEKPLRYSRLEPTGEDGERRSVHLWRRRREERRGGASGGPFITTNASTLRSGVSEQEALVVLVSGD